MIMYLFSRGTHHDVILDAHAQASILHPSACQVRRYIQAWLNSNHHSRNQWGIFTQRPHIMYVQTQMMTDWMRPIRLVAFWLCHVGVYWIQRQNAKMHHGFNQPLGRECRDPRQSVTRNNLLDTCDLWHCYLSRCFFFSKKQYTTFQIAIQMKKKKIIEKKRKKIEKNRNKSTEKERRRWRKKYLHSQDCFIKITLCRREFSRHGKCTSDVGGIVSVFPTNIDQNLNIMSQTTVEILKT